jgi:Fe-S cluster assembly protein SufD
MVFSVHTLSSTTHEGIDVCLMSSALNKPKYKMIIDNYYNQIANKEESLTSLNTASPLKELTSTFQKSLTNLLKSCILNRMSLAMVQPRNLVIVENYMFKLLNVTKVD